MTEDQRDLGPLAGNEYVKVNCLKRKYLLTFKTRAQKSTPEKMAYQMLSLGPYIYRKKVCVHAKKVHVFWKRCVHVHVCVILMVW